MSEQGKWFYMYKKTATDGEDYYLIDEVKPIRSDELSLPLDSVWVHPNKKEYRLVAPFRSDVGSRMAGFAIEQRITPSRS